MWLRKVVSEMKDVAGQTYMAVHYSSILCILFEQCTKRISQTMHKTSFIIKMYLIISRLLIQ
jgi:hypothetical protein